MLVAPRFGPAERSALNLNYRVKVTQIELTVDILYLGHNPCGG
jgi:hypothetical protein